MSEYMTGKEVVNLIRKLKENGVAELVKAAVKYNATTAQPQEAYLKKDETPAKPPYPPQSERKCTPLRTFVKLC